MAQWKRLPGYLEPRLVGKRILEIAKTTTKKLEKFFWISYKEFY